MKIYLCPSYVSIESAESFSPNLFRFLKEREVRLEERKWNGTLEALPTGEPVIIRASSKMMCSDQELGQRCSELGHFCFYDDAFIRPDGSYDRENIVEEAQKFIVRVKERGSETVEGNGASRSEKRTGRSPLPFLTTHIANVALNKQIGLVFLLQEAQETHGLTDVSHESLVSDQLHVGSWMIESFLPYEATDDQDSSSDDIWMAFEPFDISRGLEGLMNIDRDGIETSKTVVEQIEAERVALGEQLWNFEHAPSVDFLRKVVAQVDECVAYTAKRVEAIKMCSQMDPTSPESMISSLASRGPEMGAELLAGFGDMLGPIGVGPLGYLGIKNMITPPMVFSRHFLGVVRKVVEEKAIQENYTPPSLNDNCV